MSVRLNGALASAVGTSRTRVQLPDEATVAELVERLRDAHPAAAGALQSAVPFVGGRHGSEETALSDGQEVALLVPVAGG